ncbi:MAG TPA: ATP-binding protein [Bryobacteraceae bacterium]|nr:ATP-binding protein [Bryobacteraceae bacterium]
MALAALEEERAKRGRLARVLHDEVAQPLSAAGLQLDILRMDLADRIPGVTERTKEIQAMLDLVVKRIRDLSFQLSPDIVERAGLQAALDLLAGHFRRLFSGSLRLIYDSTVKPPLAVAAAIQRIAEEAIRNAVQHAQCAQIEVCVSATRRGCSLQVRDDGIGFDYDEEARRTVGLGLPTVRYYAAKAGMRLHVNSHERGTTLRVTWEEREVSPAP